MRWVAVLENLRGLRACRPTPRAGRIYERSEASRCDGLWCLETCADRVSRKDAKTQRGKRWGIVVAGRCGESKRGAWKRGASERSAVLPGRIYERSEALSCDGLWCLETCAGSGPGDPHHEKPTPRHLPAHGTTNSILKFGTNG